MDPLTFALIAGGQSVMNQIGNWNQYNQQKEKLSKGRKLIQDFETGALSNLDQASENLFSTSANAIALNSNRNPVMLGKLASDVFAQTQNQKNQIRQNTQSQMMNLLNNEPVAPSIGGGIAEAVGAGMQGYIAGEQLNMSKDYMNFLMGKGTNVANTVTNAVTEPTSSPFNVDSWNPVEQGPSMQPTPPIDLGNVSAKPMEGGSSLQPFKDKFLNSVGNTTNLYNQALAEPSMMPQRRELSEEEIGEQILTGNTGPELRYYNAIRNGITPYSIKQGTEYNPDYTGIENMIPRMSRDMNPQAGFKSPSENDMFWDTYGNQYPVVKANDLTQPPQVNAYSFDDPNNPMNYMSKEELAKKMLTLFGAGDNNKSFWGQNESAYPKVPVSPFGGRPTSKRGKSTNPFDILSKMGY